MNYALAKMLDGTAWLMEPRAFRAMLKRAESATPAAIQEAVAAYNPQPQGPKMLGDIAVIDACGPITYRSSWFSMFFGGCSIEGLQYQLRAAMADPAVKTIVFRWDSPGGCVEMVPEFADELYAAAGAMSSKPILSVADTMICSAAYWLASQTETIYATVSSRIGAIGVFVEHDDISGMLEKAGIKVTLIAHGEHKVDGNPYEPLSDSARAAIQDDVDQVGALFDAAVARGRHVSVKDVLDRFGQGDVFNGKEALSLKLADEKATFGQVIAKLTKGSSTAMRMRASGSPRAALTMRAGVVPSDVSDKKAPRDTPWSALTLADFTDKTWDKLTDAEKRHIAGHFAWAAQMPPETFGDLKLGHHRASDGAVVFRGVSAALGRLDQSDIPSADVGKVRSHLEKHQKAFENDAEKKDSKDARLQRADTQDGDGDNDGDEMPETVEPSNGECPDGYDLGDDGLCHLVAPQEERQNDDDSQNAKADHTDVGRDGGGKFATQCACHADCACMQGSGICGTKCMTCGPSCACLTRGMAESDAEGIIALS